MYPVYPAPILPTRYVDYTTSSPPPRTPPLRKPAQWLLCPPIALHTHIYARCNTRELHLPIYLRYVYSVRRDAACKPGRERIYPVYARRENIKDIASYEKTEENWISK